MNRVASARGERKVNDSITSNINARSSGGKLSGIERQKSVVITPSDSAARALSSLLATLDSALTANRGSQKWPVIFALLSFGTCLLTPYQVRCTLCVSAVHSRDPWVGWTSEREHRENSMHRADTFSFEEPSNLFVAADDVAHALCYGGCVLLVGSFVGCV